jgi:CDP-paratose 2-epimerase
VEINVNCDCDDLVNAFWHFSQSPRAGAVYNMGGSRHSNCSVLEAMELINKPGGKPVNYEYSDQARSGDHIWWISDVRRFLLDFSEWRYRYDLNRIIEEIVAATEERALTQAT